MKARIHLILHGRVQGVWYRLSTRRHALMNNLKGWVMNLPDKTVEIIAEGEKDKLRDLVIWCHKGPILSRVEKVDMNWQKYKKEFTTFSIKYYKGSLSNG